MRETIRLSKAVVAIKSIPSNILLEILEFVHSSHCHNAVEEVCIVEWYVLTRNDFDSLLGGDSTHNRTYIVEFGIGISSQFMANICPARLHQGLVGQSIMQGHSLVFLFQKRCIGLPIIFCTRIASLLLEKGMTSPESQIPQEWSMGFHLVRIHQIHFQIVHDFFIGLSTNFFHQTTSAHLGDGKDIGAKALDVVFWNIVLTTT
mmetsp:Transcript_33133/g.80070  ORF Transcript_33133/g.80070 Transcript_33133/m.80070 type:complete len:204 (-) Transcript_33133:1107-1718(-)